MDREHYMSQALELAREAYQMGEVPVGCVVADSDGVIIGRGRNRRRERDDATAHAELEAIRQACAAVGDWLYVTLEPCPMCAGAVINARVPTLVFGAREPLSGSCGSVIDLFSESYGHRPAVYAGVCREDCAALLRDFFAHRRQQ